jgi:hypothetical protein
MSKKAKGVAFTDEEHRTLMDLIDEKKNVLECKVTDKGSLKQKNETWEEITVSYNAVGPTSGPRNSKQLKKYVNHYNHTDSSDK